MNKLPEQIQAVNHCGSETQEKILWLALGSEYRKIYENARVQVIDNKSTLAPMVDFSKYGVLYIAMGQKRTGGYGLKLIEEPLTIDNDTAELVVHWQEPKPGYMVTQVLTNPCLFVKIPKGGFSQIRVKDQRGNVRAQLQVN
ncbi:protease complex subunit PrcB family protein [Kaarinaea lacus]